MKMVLFLTLLIIFLYVIGGLITTIMYHKKFGHKSLNSFMFLWAIWLFVWIVVIFMPEKYIHLKFGAGNVNGKGQIKTKEGKII